MHGFESLVGELLEADGYWVRRAYKVQLTKAEKVAIGRPSSPRWELDLIAFRPGANTLLVVECKSYLDSPGVRLTSLDGGPGASRYKLFTEPKLRRVVFARLAKDVLSQRLCSRSPKIRLALAAGRVKGNETALAQRCADRGWEFFGPTWLLDRLSGLSEQGYENSVGLMVAKLLIRNGRVSQRVSA